MVRITLAALFFLATSAQASTSLDRAKASLSKNPPDYETAIPLLVTGAKRNDPASLYLLGYLKERGYGVPTDEAGAITLYKASARQSYFPAQKRLAEMGIGKLANPDHMRQLSRESAAREQASLAKRNAEALRGKARSVGGRIAQVLPTGLLVQERECTPQVQSGSVITQRGSCYATGTYHFLETARATEFTDGEFVRTQAVSDGTYSYADVTGANRTVKKYVEIPK